MSNSLKQQKSKNIDEKEITDDAVEELLKGLIVDYDENYNVVQKPISKNDCMDKEDLKKIMTKLDTILDAVEENNSDSEDEVEEEEEVKEEEKEEKKEVEDTNTGGRIQPSASDMSVILKQQVIKNKFNDIFRNFLK